MWRSLMRLKRLSAGMTGEAVRPLTGFCGARADRFRICAKETPPRERTSRALAREGRAVTEHQPLATAHSGGCEGERESLKPVIGITCTTRHTTPAYPWQTPLAQDSQNRDYVDSVTQAGGVALLLPCALDGDGITELLGRLDGLIVAGGGDLDPSFYHEEPHEGLGAVDPFRDALDAAIIPAALERGDLPVLGICRGIQVLNVFCGGTLYQDLSMRENTTLQHRQHAPRDHASHEATIQPGTILAGTLEASAVRVNSFHHQAVRDVAPDFVVSARAPDGVIEGIELPDRRFCVAVQWHPEHMTVRHEHARQLFRALVAAAQENAPRKRP